jgi:hypothetical protein
LLLERKELIVGRKEVQLDTDGREGRNQWDESEESATRRNHLAKDLNDRVEARNVSNHRRIVCLREKYV